MVTLRPFERQGRKLMNKQITISGTGCCLVDQIYPDIDFSTPDVTKYLSGTKGDGGLHPGRLVFSEQFETYAGADLQSVIDQMAMNRSEPTLNVGGPSIVALIHAAQLLQDSHAEIRFFGVRGNDSAGEFLHTKLEQTPVNHENLRVIEGSTASTIVLSDPTYNNGHGERIFINNIGASWNFGPQDLDERFFESDIVVFGGTALVPGLHDGLTELLKRSKSKGCITVVNTVYDFRSELQKPGQRWHLGKTDDSYQYIDLLIMDREEALHLSGETGVFEAGKFFTEKGVSSFIITNGTENTTCYSDGRLFQPVSHENFPVSADLIHDLKDFRGGDTTGCGDNFVGGVLASMAWQLKKENEKLDLAECISWGTVSGGYCCFHVGGTLIEMEPGEKLELIQPYFDRYNTQING